LDGQHLVIVCQFDFIVGIESDLEFAVVGDAVWLDRHSDVIVGVAEIEVRVRLQILLEQPV